MMEEQEGRAMKTLEMVQRQSKALDWHNDVKLDTLASAMRDMDKKLTGGIEQMLRWMKRQKQESDFEGVIFIAF
jgi:hypothetical protein